MTNIRLLQSSMY